MFRTLNVGAELQKVARGQKTKIRIEDLAEVILQTGYQSEPKKRKPRKREDVAFLESLYRLEDTRA
jgi:hypothetical protein